MGMSMHSDARKKEAGRTKKRATRFVVSMAYPPGPRPTSPYPAPSRIPYALTLRGQSMWRHLKLCTRLVMVRLHPSTKTNSNSLKGSEIIAGGNMNIPMLISTLATTVSMMMNGR